MFNKSINYKVTFLFSNWSFQIGNLWLIKGMGCGSYENIQNLSLISPKFCLPGIKIQGHGL